MNKVEKPAMLPHTCAVIPGRGSDPEGFIDTLNTMSAMDPNIYISLKGLRECMKLLKWPEPEDYEMVREELTVATDELTLRKAEMDQLQEELAEANELLDAMSVVAARPKPKPKETAHD